jgi:hypothetical protein
MNTGGGIVIAMVTSVLLARAFRSLHNGPADQTVRAAWVEEFTAALRQGEPGTHVDFVADEDQARVRQAYPGRTWTGWPRSRPVGTRPTCSTQPEHPTDQR